MVVLTIFGVIGVLYFVEVKMGTSCSMFGCELGTPSRLDEQKRLPKREFFGRVVPLILTVVGLPLIGYSVFEGLVLLAASAMLLIFYWSKRSHTE